MKNKIILSMVGILFLLPAVSFASSYLYVDANGTLKEVVAVNSTDAINMMLARGDSMVDSGVKLNMPFDNMSVGGGTIGGGVYWYVDNQGMVRSVMANSANEALMMATDKVYNSGVLYMGKAS